MKSKFTKKIPTGAGCFPAERRNACAKSVWTLTEAKKKKKNNNFFSCLTFLRIIIIVVSFSFIY
jgi:hypothetical protein